MTDLGRPLRGNHATHEPSLASRLGPSGECQAQGGASLSRWLAELFRPSRKCARLGHDMGEVRQRVLLWPPEGIFQNRHVADYATEVTPRCRRCWFRGETRIEQRGGLTGLRMPSDDWDDLKRDGRLVQ